MAPEAASQRSEALSPGSLLPVGVITLVYVVVGVLWIAGGSAVADALADATPIPRWALEVGKGVLFVVISAVALRAVLARRTDRLDAAVASADRGGRGLATSSGRNRLQETALAATANAVVITGSDGTIEWVNAAFEEMSGYPASVAIGGTPRLLKSGVQDEAFYRDMWATLLSGQVWRGQLVNRRSDGGLYTVSQTITPVTDDGGDIQHFVATHEDITERVRAEDQLEHSRLRLQALFDNALDAIMLADDQGRYTEVNPAVCELTGYTREELLGMNPADLAVPDLHPDVSDQFDSFVESGAESGTFTLRRKDGRIVETEYRAVADIQPGVHLSVLRDVTARYAMLRALTRAEAEFRQLAEDAVDIVAKLQVDAAGQKLLYVNPAATTILGYSAEQLYDDPGLLPAVFQRNDDPDDAGALVPTPAEPFRLATVQVERADGQEVWLEVHSTLTDAAADAATIQLVARDVTARSEMLRALEQALDDQLAAAEQLRALNVMKDTFLQNVSHELRTPLTAILGFARLLAEPQRGLSPDVAEEFPRRILKNAERLQRLLDDLMDVDRLTRGHSEPKRRRTDLSALIHGVVHDAELGDHTVEFDLEPITMELDAPWVERIIASLLRNIVQHTSPDTRCWISARATPDGVTMIVDDDGRGIPEDDWLRVTKAFEQGTGAVSSAQPGAGIGLSLVKTFAQMHGGGLTIGASPAGGTRATVTLCHSRTGHTSAKSSGAGHWDGVALRYTTLLLDRDRAGAAELVTALIDAGTDIRDLYLRVFEPSQRDIGRRWDRDEITVGVEHYCTAATQQIMSGLYPQVFAAAPDGRRLVVFCAADEFHELGARMVADFLQLDGWDVSYLGANVPTTSVVAEVRQIDAHMVAISVALPHQIPLVAEIIATLRRDLTGQPAIIVGGRPFNAAPGLWARIGADGFAPNASEAVDMAASLVPRPHRDRRSAAPPAALSGQADVP